MHRTRDPHTSSTPPHSPTFSRNTLQAVRRRHHETHRQGLRDNQNLHGVDITRRRCEHEKHTRPPQWHSTRLPRAIASYATFRNFLWPISQVRAFPPTKRLNKGLIECAHDITGVPLSVLCGCQCDAVRHFMSVSACHGGACHLSGRTTID